jgi:hypothetical protein
VQKSETHSTLAGVHFADAHTGWAVGQGGINTNGAAQRSSIL